VVKDDRESSGGSSTRFQPSGGNAPGAKQPYNHDGNGGETVDRLSAFLEWGKGEFVDPCRFGGKTTETNKRRVKKEKEEGGGKKEVPDRKSSHTESKGKKETPKGSLTALRFRAF